MNGIANIPIGKKLTLAFGGAMLLMGCVAGLGIWSLNSVDKAVTQAQFETENLLLAKQFTNDTARVLLYTGTSVVRGKPSEEDEEHLVRLRASYTALLDQLQSRVKASEGRRLLDRWIEQGVATKAANVRVTDLSKAGKHAEAAQVFLEESLRAYDTRDATIQEFLRWQEGQVAESNQERGSLIRVLPPSWCWLPSWCWWDAR